MSKNESSVFGCFGLMVSTAVLIIVEAVMKSWALSVLWTWFIVPQFDVPRLTILQCLGIGIVASFLTSRDSDNKKNEGNKTVGEAVLEMILKVVAVPVIVVVAAAFIRFGVSLLF